MFWIHSSVTSFVGLTPSFFLKGRYMKNFGFFHKGFEFLRRNSEWLFAQQSLIIWCLKMSKGSIVNKWGTWVQVRRCCFCKSPFEDHLRLGIWWRKSNPMRRSLPVRGDPRTWCLMVRVGKILMKRGLLFKVIRNVSPFAALNIWLWDSQNSTGKILVWRIVATALVSNKAIIGIGLE